jgi:threonine dehydrogenase-like Zn-dependent dehydrogenase
VRVATVVEPGAVQIGDAPDPTPGPGEIVIEISGCGVCGSDLAVFEGRPWFEYPREPGAPGHEGWGTVVAHGAGVQGPPPGTPVAALSFHANAQYDLVHAGSVVPLPDELAGGGQPVPGEALACAMNIARRAGLDSAGTVAIVGGGFIGALLTQLAARAGARTVVVSRREFARQTALRMGADEAIPLDGDAVERVRELTSGELCGVVIEATGRQQPLDLAAELTRTRGRLVIAGYHQDGRREIDMQLWNWRGLDVVNAHERDWEVYLRGLREAVAALADGTLDPAPLYTHELPLERAGDAYRLAVERPDGFLKALLRP